MSESLKTFVEEVSKIDEIDSIVLFGSQSIGTSTSLSDIDLMICCYSSNFHTPRSVYEDISKFSKTWKIMPVIKSVSEFSPKNYLTMSPRHILICSWLTNIYRISNLFFLQTQTH